MRTPDYDAIRTGAGLLPRPDRGLLLVAGTDRTTWLQGLLTNDVAALRPGDGCYAAYLTPQGRMLSDLRVLNVGPAALLDVPASVCPSLLERLERFVITEDVTVVDWSGRLARLGLHGPAAAAKLTEALQADFGGADTCTVSADRLAGLREHASALVPEPAGGGAPPSDFDVPPGRVLVAATRDAGVLGFDLFVNPADEARLRDALVSRGASLVDADTWNVARIEAGIPVWGADMDEETIPLEAGIEDRAISFAKGCYVGQEVIVRVRDRGHGRVTRRLVGLAAPAGGDPPAVSPGDELRAGGKVVGRVTSAAVSRLLGRTIALGYVQRDLAVPDTNVDAIHGASVVTLVVVPTPFLRSDGAEPGS
jgi:folate-binding protein YgfZ